MQALPVVLRSLERSPLADFPLDYVADRCDEMPEKRLMLAILLDAIIQLRRPGSTGAHEAAAWIRGDAPESPCAFRAVCEALGLDPDYLTHGIFAWARREAGVAGSRVAQLRRPQARTLRVSAPRRRDQSVLAVL